MIFTVINTICCTLNAAAGIAFVWMAGAPDCSWGIPHDYFTRWMRVLLTIFVLDFVFRRWGEVIDKATRI